ncbi:unnamed protein product [Vicia faba]|uniref:Uncharacterized protein n=1 Tax=Vicia faba TaxID=3906 RepID=A0AAV0YHR9_VICFA|nr:unnamed protein product [Vicia faba]
MSMNMCVSNIHKNPKRNSKDAKTLERYVSLSDIHCELFIWDDEVDELLMNTRNKERFTGVDIECNNCEVILGYLKEFDNNFRKEFEKEYGKESSSKKVEKLKKLLQIERKKTTWCNPN